MNVGEVCVLILHILQYIVRIGIVSIRQLIKRFMIGLIRFYQRVAPSWIRNCCRYKPTCSQYAIMVIDEFGPIKGLFLSFLRVLRCFPPFGGLDCPPVNQKGNCDGFDKMSGM